MAEMNYYDILDVSPSATTQEIKAAYHRAVRAAHPDAGGTAGMFRLVTEAYRTLADPQTRAAYDARGQGVPTDTAGAPPGSPHGADATSRANEPPEPDWGEEVAWDVHVDQQGPPGPSPGPPYTPGPRSGTNNIMVDRLFRRFDQWMATGSGPAWIRWGNIAIVVLFAFLTYVLFAQPHWIRPAAAGPDIFGGWLDDTAALRFGVLIYALTALGGYIGLLWIPLLAIHLSVLSCWAIWLPAYWDLATTGERLTFVLIALLWFAYFVAMTVIPLLRAGRLNTEHAL